MLWHAMPPELNTARLMAGAGPAPMLQAAAGWAALGAALETQADELAVILTALGGAWTGAGGERAIAAATPTIGWLKSVAAAAQKRAAQASAQAAAYTAALATTPSMPEIAANHITRAVLVATNFLGINMVPIGLKETDYFVRMWNQAAAAMDVYQAETAVNTVFEPLPPVKPIVVPDGGQAAEAGAVSTLADLAVKAADPQALAALVSGTEKSASGFSMTEFGGKVMPFLAQVGQLSGPMQQLTQLLQPSSGLGAGAADLAELEQVPQLGLLGANPLSTHPLAGGAGPSVGAGLLRGESLPGLGAAAARTPLLSQFLDRAAGSVAPTAAAGGAAGSSAMGGAAPLGMAGGHGAQAGVARPLAAAPTMVALPSDEEPYDEPDDDQDDW